MATITKFQDFSEQLAKGVHHFGTDTFNVVLTNSAPVATNTVLTDITQISGTNGYTTGGTATTVAESEAAGTTTVTGTSVTFTAAGGAMGPFQYYVLYNHSATSPLDALVTFWNHGSAVTLADGESFTIKFNNTTPGTIFTLA
jgi:hypothetical protein